MQARRRALWCRGRDQRVPAAIAKYQQRAWNHGRAHARGEPTAAPQHCPSALITSSVDPLAVCSQHGLNSARRLVGRSAVLAGDLGCPHSRAVKAQTDAQNQPGRVDRSRRAGPHPSVSLAPRLPPRAPLPSAAHTFKPTGTAHWCLALPTAHLPRPTRRCRRSCRRRAPACVAPRRRHGGARRWPACGPGPGGGVALVPGAHAARGGCWATAGPAVPAQCLATWQHMRNQPGVQQQRS